MVAQDFIYQALRKCGQIKAGYTAQTELLNDGLTEFQAMYDAWNAQRTLNFSIPDYTYPVVAAPSRTNGLGFAIGPILTFTGTTTNTSKIVTTTATDGLFLGMPVTGAGIPAGTTIAAINNDVSITLSNAATASATITITVTPDFIGPRPETIIRMNLLMTSTSPNTRIPLSPISVEQWANILTLQLTPINVTTVFYYDPQFPQGVINCWPPLNGNSLEIFTWGFLSPPVSLTSTYNPPPGYQDAITYTLAQRLWPLCSRQLMVNRVSQAYINGQAKLARDRIKAVNAPKPKMASDYPGNRPINGAVSDWGLLLTGVPY